MAVEGQRIEAFFEQDEEVSFRRVRRQDVLSEKLETIALEDVLTRLSVVASSGPVAERVRARQNMARLRSRKGKGAGHFLLAVARGEWLKIDNDALIVALAIRLGKAIPQCQSLVAAGKRCNCRSRKEIDTEGYHLLTCNWDGQRIVRHDVVVEEWYRLVKAAGVPAQKEVSGLMKRTKAATEDGGAAKLAEKAKRDAYLPDMPQGFKFVHLLWKFLDEWGKTVSNCSLRW